MKATWFLLAVSSVLGLGGCSPKGPTKLDTEDPARYAAKIKTQVFELAKTAASKPRAAGEQGEVLLEELSVYKKQPVGEHEAIYAQLLQKCRELVKAAKSNATGQAAGKAREMRALANKLPGQVTLEPSGHE